MARSAKHSYHGPGHCVAVPVCVGKRKEKQNFDWLSDIYFLLDFLY